MVEANPGYSKMGAASFVLSFFPGLFFVGYLLLRAFSAQHGQDQGKFSPDNGAYCALTGFLLTSSILLSELLALGLGIAGIAQRERKKLFAFLGIACSVLVFAIAYAQDVFPSTESPLRTRACEVLRPKFGAVPVGGSGGRRRWDSTRGAGSVNQGLVPQGLTTLGKRPPRAGSRGVRATRAWRA